MTDVRTPRAEYNERAPQWRLMRDAVDGEDAIKAAGADYLPMPSGFAKQPDKGLAMYSAYQRRAQFPEIVAPAIKAMVGVIHSTEVQIDLPDQLLYLWESATRDGKTLESFHRQVTSELLTTGRYGILAGAPADGGDPYLTGYTAESIINWSDTGDFYVLNETGLIRDGFVWQENPKYRVLELKDNYYTATVYEGDALAADREVQPKARGGRRMEQVPFVVLGPIDVSVEPMTPPAIGVARHAVAMYQLSADYRWQLFMTGQETLFVFNADAPETVGAGVVVGIKSENENANADARYVGPAGTGITAHRIAIQDEINAAAQAGAKLFATGTSAAESGDALRIRFAAETASLTTIAMASCRGLEAALRHVGRMAGLSDAIVSTIVVHPPESFAGGDLTPQEVQALIGLTDKGMLSLETAYEKLQAGNWASPERTWEDEAKLIDAQEGGDVDGAIPPMQDPNSGRDAVI
jgi:hypothetical protein